MEHTCGECLKHCADKDTCFVSDKEGECYKDTEACELFVPKRKLCIMCKHFSYFECDLRLEYDPDAGCKDFATVLEIPPIKLDEE